MRSFLIIISLFLYACSQEEKSYQNIYQPKVLILPANTKVITIEGVYTSSKNVEIWHSAETLEKLEKQLSQF